jgi:two-component system nitrate/nitrite sensor histidine kinase NarX
MSWLRQKIERWPLANRLALAMLCVAALAITVLFYDLDRTNRAELAQLQTTALHNSANDLARALDALMENERSRVANLALSRSAQEFAGARPDQRAPLFTPTLADFSNFLDSNRPFYRAVLLLDQQGEVLISTDGSAVGQRFGTSTFFQAARAGQIYMSDPGISAIDRQPVIWLAAPVGGANAPAGVLAVALSPEEIWRVVEQVRIGEGGYALLLDRYRIRLAHGRDPRYVFRSLAPLAASTWQQLRAEGRFAGLPVIADTQSLALDTYVRAGAFGAPLIAPPSPGTGNVYYAAARTRSRDWTVVAMLSEREIFAPAERATLRGLMATVIVAALLGLTVAWMARRIVRPVPRLAAAAARIAAGDLSAPVEVRGGGEVRALAETFEMMRQRLEQARAELAAWAATLERRVTLRSQELAALSEVVALAGREQPRAALLQTALDRALPVMGAEIGGIWLAGTSGALTLAASSGLAGDLAALAAFAPGEGLLGVVQASGTAVALDDIAQSPRLARAAVRDEALRAFAAVPLAISGRVLGVLGMFSHAQAGFSPDAVGLATSIGQQIALMLDNSALVARLQEQARNVAALQERERIAGEIHDGIAQNLSYLYLQIDQLAAELPASTAGAAQARLAAQQELLDLTIAEVRQFIARLQQSAPPPGALGARLSAETERLAGELRMAVDLRVAPPGDLVVPDDVGAELSRIVGEALRNARRHGQAAHARVELTRANGHCELRVQDDGAGFDPARPPDDTRGHFGLNIMRARAARIGGVLEVNSRPGAGACVAVRWPVQEER